MTPEQMAKIIEACGGHMTILLSLIGVLFVAIIGVYAIIIKTTANTSSELGKIYGLINKHIATADIHVPSKEFVGSEVCNEVRKLNAAEFGYVKDGIGRMEKQLDDLVKFIRKG